MEQLFTTVISSVTSLVGVIIAAIITAISSCLVVLCKLTLCSHVMCKTEYCFIGKIKYCRRELQREDHELGEIFEHKKETLDQQLLALRESLEPSIQGEY